MTFSFWMSGEKITHYRNVNACLHQLSDELTKVVHNGVLLNGERRINAAVSFLTLR